MAREEEKGDGPQQRVQAAGLQSIAAVPAVPEEHVPDGGKEAWTVVLGSTLALFASAGMINAYVCPVGNPNRTSLS